MLLVNWFPCTIFLLALVGCSFSLKCKACELTEEGVKNCEVSRDCPPGNDICAKSVVKGKPSMVIKSCGGNSKENSKCAPKVGECKTVNYAECMGQQMKPRSSRDMTKEEFVKLLIDPTMEVELCVCAGDDCNAAFGLAPPNLGFVVGSAIIAATGWIGVYRALGI